MVRHILFSEQLFVWAYGKVASLASYDQVMGSHERLNPSYSNLFGDWGSYEERGAVKRSVRICRLDQVFFAAQARKDGLSFKFIECS